MSDTRNIAEQLLDVLASDLLKRIRDGEATAADLNVARQFLKDNGINCVPTKSNPLGQLKEKLPFQTPEQIAEDQENLH